MPSFDPIELREWCQAHLGSAPAVELFRAGHLSAVLGLRLEDGRQVVVKVRPWSARLAGCAEVQRRVNAAGYPCPQPLTGVVGLGGCAASAETYVSGGASLPTTGRAPRLFADAFARLIDLTPPPSEVSSLQPSPPWTSWFHQEGGLWPRPDDQDIDLNAVEGCAWMDAAARQARARLRAGSGADIVVAHGDWYAGNLRWNGDRLTVVHDWDSVIADREEVVVGFAAAVYPTVAAGGEATVDESKEFIAQYATARRRNFTTDELEQCWAAGVWLRAFDAKKQHAAGQPIRSLTEAEARERLRLAGIG